MSKQIVYTFLITWAVHMRLNEIAEILRAGHCGQTFLVGNFDHCDSDCRANFTNTRKRRINTSLNIVRYHIKQKASTKARSSGVTRSAKAIDEAVSILSETREA